MGLKFLHTSDLQIGMTRGFLGADAQPRFEAARIEAIARLGRAAADNGCAFIVMAGDVFEHNSLAPRTIGRAVEALKALPVPVFLLSGNHDPLTADSYFYQVSEIAGVTVFYDSEPIEFTAPGGEVIELVGAPLRSRHTSEDLVAQAIAGLEPTPRIRIAVGHGQVFSRGDEDAPNLIDLPLVERKLAEGSIDYLAMGDTHSAQPIGSSRRVWYSGAPEATDFRELATGGGENNSGKALVVEVTKPGVEQAEVSVEEVEVGQWTFEAPVVEVNSRAEAEEFISFLDAYPHKERTVIKYALVGTVDIATKRYLESAFAEREEVFAALYERERLMDLHLEPSEDDLAELAQGGFVGRALEELIAQAGAESEGFDAVAAIEAESAAGGGAAPDPGTVARDAINLLFRLSKES